jgi:hypothetical protein
MRARRRLAPTDSGELPVPFGPELGGSLAAFVGGEQAEGIGLTFELFAERLPGFGCPVG